MGNNITREARSSSQSQLHHSGVVPGHTPAALRVSHSHASSNAPNPPPDAPLHPRRRVSRSELSLFGIGAQQIADPADPHARTETKAEREARKLKKERAERQRERERSLMEEGVDGGFLVTLGTYTGTEDFSKAVVRQLMVERRLAPFWKGLDDHSDSWTDNQIIAAARGLPLPPAQQTTTVGATAIASTTAGITSSRSVPPGSASNTNKLAVPVTNGDDSNISATSICENSSAALAQPASSHPAPSSPFGSPPSSSPFFRGRAKTLAALTTSRNTLQPDMTPQELQLPRDPIVQGHQIEAFLYKDVLECPICFLYYPPYLNKTRCCDQPICSECFVQIKRPDPHPPEHHDDPDNPHPPEAAEPGPHDEYMLVSEPATCPFCKQPEFGITYDPPSFRRGLTYGEQHRLASVASAMSSSSSVNSYGQNQGTRRRTTSLGANSPNVITTDRVRPDWAKKLSDARAHALRRAAAATALHNAAYVLGNGTAEMGPRLTFGRRRRTLFGNDGVSRHSSAEGLGQVGALLAAAERHGASGSAPPPSGQNDLFPSRFSSRRSRIDDLEDLMMMEAIRLSLAAEEERKKKEEKDAVKNAKKDEKQKAKDAKKAEKAARKGSASSMLYSPSMNQSNASQLTTGDSSTTHSGKGKAPDRGGMAGSSTSFPGLTSISSHGSPSSSSRETPQRHLEQSRANMLTPSSTGGSASHKAGVNTARDPSYHHLAPSQLSGPSSSASSFVDSGADYSGGHLSFEQSPNGSNLALDGHGNDSTCPDISGGGAGTEPMFNFRSLAAVIGHEDNNVNLVEHLDHPTAKRPSMFTTQQVGPTTAREAQNGRHSGDVFTSRENASFHAPRDGRSVSTGERMFGVSNSNGHSMGHAPGTAEPANSDARPVMKDGGASLAPQDGDSYDTKHYGDISVLESDAFEGHTRAT